MEILVPIVDWGLVHMLLICKNVGKKNFPIHIAKKKWFMLKILYK